MPMKREKDCKQIGMCKRKQAAFMAMNCMTNAQYAQ